MQKEAEFFENAEQREYTIHCFTGDFSRNDNSEFTFDAGWAMHYHPNEDCDPVYLQTARGKMRVFKTIDAAFNLLLSKGVMHAEVWFEPR